MSFQCAHSSWPSVGSIPFRSTLQQEWRIVPTMAGIERSILAIVIQGYQLDSPLKVACCIPHSSNSSMGLMCMVWTLPFWPSSSPQAWEVIGGGQPRRLEAAGGLLAPPPPRSPFKRALSPPQIVWGVSGGEGADARQP